MTFTRDQEKKLLAGLIAIFAVVVLFRVFTAEKPRTAPLTYQRGAVAASTVRSGRLAPSADTDPILLLLSRREEKFPAATRDLFRMQNPAPRPKPAPAPVVPVEPAVPPVPVKTPEEIAADAARADLSRFRFYGYVTAEGKGSSLFLAKDGELFIARIGETILKNYEIKEAGKEHVVLLDTVTRVEVRIELSGAAEQMPRQTQQQAPWQMQQQAPRQMPHSMPRAPQPPE